ncbi:putative DNA primase/helicase [Nitrosomonas aestuarii]|uniref:Putative DNA primase/helicase n=1 Tax=Nitrosomonas aestuarii TaxID=52441 RepID=A0A1I4D3K5_9PROT|nr:DUF927 domain-containing protein [Nitrosomonas aestuarii]SFK87390.1 putative DNA primase/helicase [Nitrosomonas aestuarii]
MSEHGELNTYESASIAKGAVFLDEKAGNCTDIDKTGVTEVTRVTALITKLNNGNLTKESDDTKATNQIPKKEDCPVFRVFDEFVEYDKKKLLPGVWYFETNKDNDITKTRVCSPLHIEAVTYDSQNNNFGRLLRFQTTLKVWRNWAMPMELLKGDGSELRGELLAMGLEIQPGLKVRNLLSTYLQSNPPNKQIQCALQAGWCNDSFVLPDKVYGKSADKIIFQSGERQHGEYTTAGTLQGWQENIAAYAVNNPVLTLAISSAFAGALLKRCHVDSGGVHFVGESSTGKSTAGIVAGSVWGGKNYRRTWRTTSNGLEGVAMLFNDGLLVLDEIGECDPREVGAMVYALGNGKGKQRANRSGNARSVNNWQCFVLSNGEHSIPTIMREGGHRCNAGQEVRLLDLPVERQYGIFDDLHDFEAGDKLSDRLKEASTKHYGMAGRKFLEKVTHDSRDFTDRLQKIKDSTLFHVDNAQGQHKRAAARFALIGLAGELATEYGITGWSEGAALKAAAECFKIWCSTRGKGNTERHKITEQVNAFIDRHGDSRFSAKSNTDSAQTKDRAGWWEDSGGERLYLFTKDGMHEALKGFDFKRGLDVLENIGALQKPGNSDNGKRTVQRKIGGKNRRLYAINATLLSDSVHES